MRIERFPVGPLDNNCYLLTDESSAEAIVVDPSMESEEVLNAIRERVLNVRRILLTHAHFDHILMVRPFHEQTGAPVWLHRADSPIYARGADQASAWGFGWPGDTPIGRWIEDGEEVGLPGIPARAWHTPGHSPGSVTFETPAGLICGDVLFRGSVGRTDLPGGDWETLVRSIQNRLFRYPPETRVYPGHGPETTIGLEAKSNPFVGQPALGRT